MQAEKRTIQARTDDKALAQHAAEVGKVLQSIEVAELLSSKYPGVASVSLVRGNKFGVQGYDQKTHTLKCGVNIGSPIVTGQQFRRQFTTHEKKAKPPETLGIEVIDPQQLGQLTGMTPRQLKREIRKMARMSPEEVMAEMGGVMRADLGGPPSLPPELLGGEKPEVRFSAGKKPEDALFGVAATTLSPPLKQRPKSGEPEPKYEFPRKVNWPEIQVPEDVLRKLAYGDLSIPGRALLREQYEYYFSGSYVDEGGISHFTTLGEPMCDLVEANLFYIKGDPKVLSQSVAYPFKIGNNAERIVVPIVGDFYGKDGVITEELERKGIIERVRDEQGNPVTAPLYVKTMRQLYQVTHGSFHIFKIGERKIIPNSPEAVEEAWSLIHPDGKHLLHQFVDMVLEKAYADQGYTEPYDEFARKFRPKTTIQAGIGLLTEMKKTKDEIIARDGQAAADEQIKIDLSSFEDLRLPVCGTGIKGAGCWKYDGNHVYVGEGGKVDLPPNFIVVGKDGRTAFVVDERFKDVRGYMAAIPHQPWSRRPVGGNSIQDLLAFGRENELMKHGAQLSYITTAVIPLLSKDQVPDLCTDQAAIATNVVLDDSRRAGDLLDLKFPLEAVQDAYKAIVVEKYAKEKLTAQDDPIKFMETHLDEARDAHWSRMCRNVGKNLRAMFDAGFTNPYDRNMIGNISLDGGLCDVVDLSRMKHKREFHSTLNDVLGGLSLVYKVAGLNPTDFFLSRHFKGLLKESLGEKEAERLSERMGSFIREGESDNDGVKRAKAIGLVTDSFLKSAGINETSVWEMDDRAFLDMLALNEGLRKKANIDPRSVEQIRHSLTTGQPVYGSAGGPWIMVSDIPSALERYKVGADLYLRSETGRDMQENFAEIKREYAEKYATSL
ncbi:MAG: hypothetical protein PHG85_05700 [Candidatus Altiarchaeota archaeon]|nr:hypothetical protein [Candidatus Altiarchaeota archaeon]